jgi:signal transduction histidine kinase
MGKATTHMNPADVENQIKYAIIPLALLSSSLVLYPLIGLDGFVLSQFGVPLETMNFPWWLEYGHLILVVPCIMGMFVSQRLSPQSRVIVLLQLLIVLLGLEAFLSLKRHIFIGTASTAVSLFIGVISGVSLQNIGVLSRSREKGEAELVLRNRTATESQLQLVRQDEVERRMLAGDLHDQVLNDLRLVRQELKNQSKGGVAPDDPLDEQLSKVMTGIRRVMDNLCPLEIEHIGLQDAVEACLERGAELSGYSLRFRSKVDKQAIERLSKIEQLLLFRLVQETVNNICKHSTAKNVVAEIAQEEDILVVRISDDGKGIAPDKLQAESRGMRYMRQRAGLIGGTVGWKTGIENQGVTVEIKVPPHIEEVGHNAT